MPVKELAAGSRADFKAWALIWIEITASMMQASVINQDLAILLGYIILQSHNISGTLICLWSVAKLSITEWENSIYLLWARISLGNSDFERNITEYSFAGESKKWYPLVVRITEMMRDIYCCVCRELFFF